MRLDEGDGFDAPYVEATLWGLTGVLALVLVRRAAPGTRIGWWVVALGTAVIVFDKLDDVYSYVHAFGRGIAAAIDPELQLRGRHALYRDGALGIVFLAGAGGLFWLVRRDADLGRAKLLCYTGFLVVLGLLVVRVMPTLQEHLPAVLTKSVEGIAWLMVLMGEWLGLRRKVQAHVRADGFL